MKHNLFNFNAFENIKDTLVINCEGHKNLSYSITNFKIDISHNDIDDLQAIMVLKYLIFYVHNRLLNLSINISDNKPYNNFSKTSKEIFSKHFSLLPNSLKRLAIKLDNCKMGSIVAESMFQNFVNISCNLVKFKFIL